MWHFIFEAVPKDHDVLLAVLDHEGFHALEFPCRRSDDGRWIDVTTGRSIEVHPTHWCEWPSDVTEPRRISRVARVRRVLSRCGRHTRKKRPARGLGRVPARVSGPLCRKPLGALRPAIFGSSLVAAIFRPSDLR
jgi:hypothetical protein